MNLYNSKSPHGGGKQEPKLIIVHAMGEFIIDNGIALHAKDFLLKYKLSAHALISPNGDVYRCRMDDEQAWHARGFNKNSLGVEFLVEGKHDYRTFVETIKGPYIQDEQIESGLEIIKTWIGQYDIKNIKRHSDVSPGRKVDPGEGFPWESFVRRLENV